MLDQESDETFVRAKWRAMDADRNLLGVVAVFVAKIKIARLREIYFIGGNGKLASDDAPRLYVNLRPVKGRFIGHLDIIDIRSFQNITCHLFGLSPKLRFIHKFLPELGWIMRGET